MPYDDPTFGSLQGPLNRRTHKIQIIVSHFAIKKDKKKKKKKKKKKVLLLLL
jgi:hypothetical protein